MGIFWISFELLENEPAMMLKIFAQTVIYDARADLSRHMVEYKAISPAFEEVEEGYGPIPEYRWMCKKGETPYPERA